MARDERLLGFARSMRQHATPFEQKLWIQLRAKRFAGAKFRRQVVVGRFIVDFACRIPRMLVVEVDGDSHGMSLRDDALRDAELRGLGYEVLRFTNLEVANNLYGVLTNIAGALDGPSLSPDSPSLSPLSAASSLP